MSKFTIKEIKELILQEGLPLELPEDFFETIEPISNIIGEELEKLFYSCKGTYLSISFSEILEGSEEIVEKPVIKKTILNNSTNYLEVYKLSNKEYITIVYLDSDIVYTYFN